MKKTIILTAIIFAALYQTCSAQIPSKNIPLPFWVSNSFQRDFSDARNVSWEKVKEIYVASFKTKRSEVMAYYENDGNLVGVGKSVNIDDLPEELTRRFAKEYHGYSIQKAVEYSPSLVVTGITGKNSLGTYPNADGTLYFLYITNAQFEEILKIPSWGSSEIVKSRQKI